MSRLRGRRAVVTGGAGGIGRAICAQLSAEGATVAALDAVAPAAGRDPAWTHLTVDVTSEVAVREAMAEACVGGLDALVTAAAVTGPAGPPHEVDEAGFERLFAVNVKGPWLATKYAVPHMLEGGRGGAIVHLSSIAGLVGGTSAQSLYHATKGAVRLMSKADAVTYAGAGIRVNSVHPGSVDTPLSRQVARDHPLGEAEHTRRVLSSIPLGRRGTPIDVAEAVTYLLSDAASWVTGTELVIDGGYTAR